MKGGQGSTKSHARKATGNSKGGNLGKPIGDKGQKGANRKTRQVADRYK